MPERDWSKDWELVCEIQAVNDPQNKFQCVLDVCIYWLQRAKDLECELRQSDVCIDVLRHANRQLREGHEKLREKLLELKDVCRDLVEALEIAHPVMNPDEPCVVYEAWHKGREALRK